MAFLNQGEVVPAHHVCWLRESIYEKFIDKVIAQSRQIKRGNPLDTEMMAGAQTSKQQFDKILGYVQIGNDEGAEVLMDGEIASVGGGFSEGNYIEPTIMKGGNKMRIRIFKEEIFCPHISVTTFTDEAEALAIANDTQFGLGAGLWTRDMKRAYRMRY